MAIGETILGAALQVLFDRLASPEVVNFFRRSKIDRSLFPKLKVSMLAAKKLVLDAEQKQMTDPAVKDWLDELKHWFLRAEEVMDQIVSEALRSSVEIESPSEPQSLVTKVLNFKIMTFSTSSSFLDNVTLNIREIVDVLERMLTHKDALGLRELSQGRASQRVQSTCLPEGPKVLGRDREREHVIKVLLSEKAKTERVGVVAIVGMGGLGKTSLAKMVYNDARVQRNFDFKAWVCVSDQFDISWVTRLIIESATHQTCSLSQDLNTLQLALSNELRGKKLLLVLDDVWNEKTDDWEALQAPFSVCATGSKIVVTTRNKEVASAMRSELVFRLEPLPYEDAWSLFSRDAFEGRKLSSNPFLEEIGKKVVQKCKGLPLAIKTLSGLLRCTDDGEEWEAILQSSLWDLPHNKTSVMPALWVSYYHLPPHLKPCFSYCAIFPKDCNIDCNDLVLLWMAENFVQPMGNKRMEDVGHQYLCELLSRSFLESANDTEVRMHDVMHDLAQGVAGKFLARHEHGSSFKAYERIRHFSYQSDEHYDALIRFQAISKAEFLRTLLRQGYNTSYGCSYSYLTNKVPLDIIPRLHCLRVLYLPGYANLVLPESIGSLKLLRYLNIAYSNLNQLPESLCTLYNLQTLVLSYCRHLKRLPNDMSRLGSLRHLDIRGTTSLLYMPKEMGKLKSLQTLTDFVVGKNTGSGIQELRELREIRGKFAFRRLPNATVLSDAYAFDLKSRNFIVDLELEFDAVGDDNSQKDREMLEILKPPSAVERLTIRDYHGTTFPKWLDPGCVGYEKVQFLCLCGCQYCFNLPPLGQLPSLKKLEIEGMDCITKVGHEFYGRNGCAPFPALESLCFKNMKAWMVWSSFDSEGQAVSFPRLKNISLYGCRNLKGHLPFHTPSLEELNIDGCEQLVGSKLLPSARLMSHADALQPARCPCPHAELTNVFGVTSITKLILQGLPQLKELPVALVTLLSLTELEINKCHSLKSLADVPLPSLLVHLRIYRCEVLESLPRRMISLRRLQILLLRDCPRLRCLPGSWLPTSVSFVDVFCCDRCEFPIPAGRMKHYTFLDMLCFHGLSSNFVSFPLGIFPNLQHLSLFGCDGLEKVHIPEGIIGNSLMSLSALDIFGCPRLEMIGSEIGSGEATMLPTPNLRYLSISDCQEVKPVVIEREGEVLLPKLMKLKIDKSEKITTELPLRQSLSRFPCLRGLEIEYEEVECFPVADQGWGSLPTNLETLSLQNCRNLRRLDGKALQTLTSLRKLDILDCPELERLPEEELPPSLGSLCIRRCPNLEERCQPPTGQDWPKVHHIPYVEINTRCVTGPSYLN